jgi:apolipoprotein N-acyltransferase
MAAISFRRALSLAVLSAMLTSLSFVPYNVFPLGFLGFLPLFYVFERFIPNKKQIFWLWTTWIIILNLIGYHWIMHTIAVYGMMPEVVAFPLFLLYTFGFGGKMLLFFIFLVQLKKRQKLFATPLQRLLAVSAAFAVCEILGWQLFPWYGANIVSGDLLFAQTADLLGTRGVSILWVALQYMAHLIIAGYRTDTTKRSLWQFLKSNRFAWSLAGLLIASHLYGALQWQRFTASENAAPKIAVGVPQGNVPLITSYHERPYIIARMVAQTQKLVADATAAGRKLDLIVWPESSIPAMELQRSAQLQSIIANMQKLTQTPIIINDILHDQRTGRDYSNMWQLDANGAPVNSYQKNFLLPFGEFMPMGERFPKLKNLFPAVSDFSHGERFSLFELSTSQGIVTALPLICYEIILPDYARDFDAKTGREAQFIVNITNDAWFGNSVESLQHMTLGVMRSIELRIPNVRATNSGISAYISTTGRITGETKLFERVNQVYQVPVMPRVRTLFSYVGNIPVYVFILFVFGYLFFSYRKHRAA